MEQNISPMSIGIGLGILLLAFILYNSFTPSESKAASVAESNFSVYPLVTKLAPLGCPQSERLCDYYLASSSYSVFPAAKIYDYISDSVITEAIKAGVRLVELDIYSDSNDKPVVGLKNQKLGIDYAYNTVPFEACVNAIGNNAFNSVSSAVSSDPFILSLVFHTNKTIVINAAAEILKTSACKTFMLDKKFGYQRINLAIEPICNLQSKLIIVSGGSMKGTLMEELVNLSWSESHCRRLTYTQASQTYDAEELIEFNRNNITIVVPDIGEDLVNKNPQILFTYGCQWIMMNYGSLDSMMELYIGEFQQKSTSLKPAALRPQIPKQYKQPAVADPNLSFQPMKQTSPIYKITV